MVSDLTKGKEAEIALKDYSLLHRCHPCQREDHGAEGPQQGAPQIAEIKQLEENISQMNVESKRPPEDREGENNVFQQTVSAPQATAAHRL